MADYQSIVQHISSLTGSSRKADLKRLFEISKLLHSPQKKIKIIHIAGTNGKGSVALKIAKSLELLGYRCGLFTSPHLFCFRERIQINQQKISEETVVRLFEQIQKTGAEPLTFFEYCTLLGLLYFAEERVDFAILEVGLGGRFDATNFIDPVLSVITSIGLDHMEVLGSTEEGIAKEKAGIIKPTVPVVIGPNVPYHVIAEIAEQNKAPLTQVHGSFTHYGLENAAIASCALKQLNFLVPDCTLEPPCRFEEIYQGASTFILDVAHNPQGIARLIQRLQVTYPNQEFHFIIGFSSSKDIDTCVKLLSEAAKSISILDLTHPRLASPQTLAKFFVDPVTIEAPDKILHKKGFIVVCGSFFIMNSIRKLLHINA